MKLFPYKNIRDLAGGYDTVLLKMEIADKFFFNVYAYILIDTSFQYLEMTLVPVIVLWIHSTNPKSRPVVIIDDTCLVIISTFRKKNRKCPTVDALCLTLDRTLAFPSIVMKTFALLKSFF